MQKQNSANNKQLSFQCACCVCDSSNSCKCWPVNGLYSLIVFLLIMTVLLIQICIFIHFRLFCLSFLIDEELKNQHSSIIAHILHSINTEKNKIEKPYF